MKFLKSKCWSFLSDDRVQSIIKMTNKEEMEADAQAPFHVLFHIQLQFIVNVHLAQ